MITNRILSDYNYDTLSLIEKQLNYIVEKYHVNINFHDIYGMYNFNPEIKKLFLNYYFHDNIFCNNAKRNDKLFFNCIAGKNRIAKKCEQIRRPFYGSCPMGIEEYIFPIFHKDRIFAFFCVGQFSSDIDRTFYIMKRTTDRYKMDFEKAKNDYLSINKSDIPDTEDFFNDMNIACKLVLLLFNEYGYEFQSNTAIIKHLTNNTVKQAVDFIKTNFYKNISTRNVADYCFCNESYLSSVFKNKMGMTVTAYINRERLNKAKYLLDWTDESVTNIAYRIGYNDSAYFSRIYRNHFGKSPSKDRCREKMPQ